MAKFWVKEATAGFSFHKKALIIIVHSCRLKLKQKWAQNYNKQVREKKGQNITYLKLTSFQYWNKK